MPQVFRRQACRGDDCGAGGLEEEAGCGVSGRVGGGGGVAEGEVLVICIQIPANVQSFLAESFFCFFVSFFS